MSPQKQREENVYTCNTSVLFRKQKKQNLWVKVIQDLNVKIKGNEKYEFYSIHLQCHSTSHSTQPNPSYVLENATQPNPAQPMDGSNPCPSLRELCEIGRTEQDVV